ncbi:MAG: hypothetical protein CL608_28765 [Anaerolineaceae bacterium]|nr:hypothetical protein [Anaerolineaceae bacterium]
MSEPVGTYTFVPWIRQGVANNIIGVTATGRATVDIPLEIEGTLKDGGLTTEPVGRTVELYGPGDIIGIDRAQISRIEPEHWVTDFEPNYLVSIEFFLEVFPWLYSPALPDGRKLLPWLALIVLEEGVEFKEGADIAGRPLPFIEITADFADVLPDASEGWAWAHAHFNAEFSAAIVEEDSTIAAEKAQQVIDQEPDTANSRLLCPRKLKPKTAYHAFLIPAFESGRLAGLGYNPSPLFEDAANALSATSSAWGEYGVPANRPDATYFPFYHRWYFSTAERGDFESLVRLLQPKVVDSRVGHRDMDVADPAPNISGITDANLGGILRLGGALKAPAETLGPEDQAEFEKYDQWATPYPHDFQSELATFVNLADSYQDQGSAANSDPSLDDSVNTDPDPLITPPIYGRWHALTERLLIARDGSDVDNRENWVHDLNLDPRWRTAAGFGTEVVQKNQEEYMDAAWDQIGDVLEANRRIRQAQLAKAAGRHLHTLHVAGSQRAAAGQALLLAAPMQARLVSGGLTLRHQVLRSPLNAAVVSTAMRRAIRPGGKLAKRLELQAPGTAATVVTRVNDGEITAAPPKIPPSEIMTPDDLADAVEPQGPAEQFWVGVGQWLLKNGLLAIVLLLVLIAVLLVFGLGLLGLGIAAAIIAGTVAIYRKAVSSARRQAAADAIREENQSPESVADLPGSAGFTLVTELDPRRNPPLVHAQPGESDNVEAARFKAALSDQYRLIGTSKDLGQVPPVVPLDLGVIAADIVAETRPEITVPRWTFSGISIPGRILEQLDESFVEAMAYPEFDIPMYEPLVKAGTDLFVPNLHLVEPDSVTLLETNQRFIEAYMVGLNHEFARELLWREYPTDQRGSYFRQFWDVRKKIAESADPETAREELKDIPPLDEWSSSSDLGDHDNREAGREVEEELVLVIRGELLKKYPNTIVTAQKAAWQTTDEQIDKSLERVFDTSEAPMKPLYEARVAPDIFFFGFDLTAEKARGDDTVDDKPGYFFRIEEVPGDARFGFDISREPDTDINVWNDVAWADIAPGFTDGVHLKVADIPSLTLTDPTGDPLLQEKVEQYGYDVNVPLDSNVSSAELAYIALQTPVIMGVHASELLPDQENGGE